MNCLEPGGSNHLLKFKKVMTDLSRIAQGTASNIVRDKGNHESFCSCCHWVDRKLVRKQAIGVRDLKKVQQRLDRLGNRCSPPRNDLVDIEIRLRPLKEVKG